jgi:hypothetical protein
MRDENGRWLKGVSGNHNGRPRKLSQVDFGELERFKNTVIEVPTPDGRRVLMTRQAAIQERLYASAMKGNVHAQIYLARRFEKYMQDRAELTARLDALTADLVETKRVPTHEEARWIHSARVFLGELPRPGEKIKKPRSRQKSKRRGDDSRGS